ncbi:Fe-S metabolism associated domain SufE-like protein [Gracilaria domingensis]|nr:Fe-S metabolism associated domain SufE-like protein [Gracilaria domingensis]
MVAQRESLDLPPALQKYVNSFAMVPDPKLRYQQLLFFAKQLPPMDSSLKVDENRVHGCTSVVHVKVSMDNQGLIRLQGDSDSQLTKGLLSLLINGLDGATPSEIQAVSPTFISVSGLAVSLTPSRNNGFINMLAKIKKDVAALSQESENSSQDIPLEDSKRGNGVSPDPNRPVYSAIMKKLQTLKPTDVHVRDDSAQHAGHAGSKGYNGESHFAVYIVSDAFKSLSQVKRHRIIYTLLADEMSAGYIHAIQINAKTPEEVQET